MGQELTARTKYRGLVKRRLMPVAIEGPLPAPGTPVTAGRRRGRGPCDPGADQTGLAVLRLDALDSALKCGPATLVPRMPAWMQSH